MKYLLSFCFLIAIAIVFSGTLLAQNKCKCEPCSGTGWTYEDRDCDFCDKGQRSCTHCDGSKKEPCSDCHGDKTVKVKCQPCYGSGLVNGVKCEPCDGEGLITQTCGLCSGEGTVTCSVCKGKGTEDCNMCGAKGFKTWKFPCDKCKQSGQVDCP